MERRIVRAAVGLVGSPLIMEGYLFSVFGFKFSVPCLDAQVETENRKLKTENREPVS
jgi:hypothetical protein